jgi:integrase/recombinase XerD
VNRAALRFLYVKVLKQSWFEEQIPVPSGVPICLRCLALKRSPACWMTTNLKHWTIMALFYGTGVRANELRLLHVGDIDSERLVLHIREGKGQVPRDIALSQPLLKRLRIYWRWRPAPIRYYAFGYAREYRRYQRTAGRITSSGYCRPCTDSSG